MLHFLKKGLELLLLPLPLLLLCALAGLCLLWLTPWQRAGKTILTAAVLALLLCSLSPVPEYFAGILESRYHQVDTGRPALADAASGCRWIVVLDAGESAADSRPVIGQLPADALARVVESVRLYRALPGSRILLSGGYYSGQRGPGVKARLATSMGVSPQALVLAPTATDTEDEARQIFPTVGKAPFLLVTSATHMPRALALFRKRGMSPLPAPADYAISPHGLGALVPVPDNLAITTKLIHEFAGLAFARMTGKIAGW